MKPNVRVQSIIDRFPEVENIFSMYEIELDEESAQLTVEQICDQFDVDIEDILLDLEEFLEDSRRAKWLANGSEEWTEGFTEEEELYNHASDDDSGKDDTDDSFFGIDDD